MGRDWDAVFNSWAAPISDTEAEKAERAERMIRKAIAASSELAGHDVRVFAQGSYKNETNVRHDSDVDIAVCLMDVFVADYELAKSVTDAEAGNVASSYTKGQFKNDVAKALTDYFGASAVTRGDKAFDIHENTSRLDADVVACLEHRLYEKHDDGELSFRSGTNIVTDSEKQIQNYPKQHYEEGCTKNAQTSLVFKRVVRILKRLKNEMTASEVAAAKPIQSFLIESLVWNAPNAEFAHDSYYRDVRSILIYLYNQLKDADATDKWCEVNNIKYLFRSQQPWTREQALAFVEAAWAYVGYE